VHGQPVAADPVPRHEPPPEERQESERPHHEPADADGMRGGGQHQPQQADHLEHECHPVATGAA
jgi:hypothetical protein